MAYKLFKVLRGAEPESAVCPGQKWPLRPQNGEIQDGHHRLVQMYLCTYLVY